MFIHEKHEKERAYLTRPEGRCWVGVRPSHNYTKMVTRYSEAMIFCCEYDGVSLGDEFKTQDVNQALAWLYA